MWRTESRSPGLSDASDGVPHAAASTTVMPHPSFGEGNRLAQAARNSASFRASLTKPWNVDGIRLAELGGEPLELRPVVAGARDVEPQLGPGPACDRQRLDRQPYSFITLEPSHVQEPRLRGARLRGRRA